MLEQLKQALKRDKRLRRYVLAVLAFGFVASVAANVLNAEGNTISRLISAWASVALLLSLELVTRIPVTRWYMTALRVMATIVVAGVAAWVSYWHMQAVAARYGEGGTSSYLLPLTVDGLIVVASVSLVELTARIREKEERILTATEVMSLEQQVNEVGSSLPVPISPAARVVAQPAELIEVRRDRQGRGGPQVTGPSRPGLSGRPLMEAPPQV